MSLVLLGATEKSIDLKRNVAAGFKYLQASRDCDETSGYDITAIEALMEN